MGQGQGFTIGLCGSGAVIHAEEQVGLRVEVVAQLEGGFQGTAERHGPGEPGPRFIILLAFFVGIADAPQRPGHAQLVAQLQPQAQRIGITFQGGGVFTLVPIHVAQVAYSHADAQPVAQLLRDIQLLDVAIQGLGVAPLFQVHIAHVADDDAAAQAVAGLASQRQRLLEPFERLGITSLVPVHQADIAHRLVNHALVF